MLEEVRSSRAELRPFSRDYRLVTRYGRVVWVHDESVPVLDAAGEPEFIQGYFVDIVEAQGAREGAAARPKDGGARAARSRDRPRLQQLPDGDSRVRGARSALDGERSSCAQGLLEIAQTAERATKLTEQLLAFGGAATARAAENPLDKVVCDLASMLGQVAGWKIDLEFDLSPTPLVYADAGQLGQAVVNLVANARDAMPDGGTLTLRTSCARLRQGTLRPCGSIFRPASMSSSRSPTRAPEWTTRREARVFDPFFTTKTSDRGTGLGLSIVHGIIRQSGGAVDVTSEPGHGTTFRLLLPSLQ